MNPLKTIKNIITNEICLYHFCTNIVSYEIIHQIKIWKLNFSYSTKRCEEHIDVQKCEEKGLTVIYLGD